MNETQNPFADRSVTSEHSPARGLWITAATLAVIVVAALGWAAFHQQSQTLDRIRAELEKARTEFGQVRAELDQRRADLERVRAGATRSQAEAAELRGKLAGTQARVSDLEKEKETAVRTHKGLEEEMRAQLESKDVTISELQGKLTVNILDRILFDSGEAILKQAGEAVLQKIAGILAQHPTLKIHVIGHTDNVPIRANARSRFTSNWDLSTARALAAVRFLTETAGVDPHRVGAVGYGEFRPIADNSTLEGRAQNRRIAISILADELAGADTAPAVKTNSIPLLVPPEQDNAASEDH